MENGKRESRLRPLYLRDVILLMISRNSHMTTYLEGRLRNIFKVENYVLG